MTAPIFFNVSEARNQLLDHKLVFTLRKPKKTVGYATARQGNLPIKFQKVLIALGDYIF